VGVNLIPEVNIDSLIILEREFIKFGTPPSSPKQVPDGSVEDGCTTYGIHKILKFDMYCKNIGNEELIIGDRNNDNLFKNSIVHGRIFKYPFFRYALLNTSGKEYVTLKHPFCLTDDRGDCNDQRIGPNRMDAYTRDHQCQFIVIDGIQSGNYILEATVNYFTLKVINDEQIGFIIKEDKYDDNTTRIPVTINGDLILPQ
jgi:hypothetical protein